MREELAEEDILVEWGGTSTRPVRLQSYPFLRKPTFFAVLHPVALLYRKKVVAQGCCEDAGLRVEVGAGHSGARAQPQCW